MSVQVSRRRAMQCGAAACVCGSLYFSLSADATDARLGRTKTLNDDFTWTPPRNLPAWEARKEKLRTQVLLSQGLWPMPARPPITAVVTGRLERPDHTIEKVAFASLPGHYVVGNLYRPVGPVKPRPAVLFAHGHWANGRLHVASDQEAQSAVARGQESTLDEAKFFMQAIPITLARLGFVVFQYDMIGYGESTAIPHILKSGVIHPDAFSATECELRLQSLCGLQTWNSSRCLDFLETLPDVDKTKLAITGASGGGTQTFLLGAVDDRVAAAFPAVMVSTQMQGGCVCENASYLRLNTGNVELAALMAPRPLALSGADDWTREIMTKGYPELKQLYRMYGMEENVAAKAWVKFPHNFGKPSREFMYTWFRTHLLGNADPVTEVQFTPTPVDQLKVFDAEHPRPKDELPAKLLRAELTRQADAALKATPKLDEVRRATLEVMVNTTPLGVGTVSVENYQSEESDGYTVSTATLARRGSNEAVPTVGWIPPEFDQKKAVIWLHPQGAASLTVNGKPNTDALALVKSRRAVLTPDVFGCGALALPKPWEVNKNYAGFTFGYNRSYLAQQIHDVLTCWGNLRFNGRIQEIELLGFGELGPVAILAAALAGSQFTRTIADAHRFHHDAITTMNDKMLMPGLQKYGGLPGFHALAAKAIILHNVKGTGLPGDVEKWTDTQVVQEMLK